MSFTGGSGGGDSKGNALWEEGEGGSGEWVWRIEEGAGMWIGVAEEAKFGPGYQLKVISGSQIFFSLSRQGLLYGGPGNLSDGSSLVTGHWGPKFAPGDNIGMKVQRCLYPLIYNVYKQSDRWRLWTGQRLSRSVTTKNLLVPPSPLKVGREPS